MTNREQTSPLDVAGAYTGTLVALGTIVMSAFPFALPLLALTAVAALPFLLLPLALVLVATLLATPVVLVRRLARRVSHPGHQGRRLHDDTTPCGEPRIAFVAR